MERKYYFAYGSNMDLKQMKARCPGSKFIKVGILRWYEFVYDGYSSMRKGAVANIIKNFSETVYGALFEISEDDEKSLDGYEGYPYSYNKTIITVEDKKRNKYKALVYLRNPEKKGRPPKEYKGIVVNAAKSLKLPDDYINNFLNTK